MNKSLLEDHNLTDMDMKFQQRCKKRLPLLKDLYNSLYGTHDEIEFHFQQLMAILKQMYNKRKPALKELDIEREEKKRWFLHQDVIGMMMYVDLFAGDLASLRKRIPYLKELKINYLHLMPLLKTRPGKNDGGYAVQSYREVEPRLGTMEDLETTIDVLRQEGISVCIDFVLNHTAKEHEWAQRAWNGEKKYQDMYILYDDDTIPNQYEETVTEVFPLLAPGNFTYYEEIEKYVWTSFYDFQWDLNFKNPYVLNKMIENMLFLANKGVEILRLDAIAFMWKELGTTCRNLPQVHTIIQILRAVSKIVCPAIIFKGEAIVEPHEIVRYFGTHRAKECQLMYNASYMVLIWNSLATKDTRLMQKTIQKEKQYEVRSTASWINYVRCHDDIGWGFDAGILRELGQDPFEHKRFLINFYRGNLQYSWAKGELYEFNPMTLDVRSSGTLASLSGLEKAIEESDEYQQELAIKRILLLHAMILTNRGIPMLYSGDEIAMLNDYELPPDKKVDSRWIHRNEFNWERAKDRHNAATIVGKVFQGLKRLIDIRTEHPIFKASIEINVFETSNNTIFGFQKISAGDKLIVLANFSQQEQRLSTKALHNQYIGGIMTDLIQGKKVDLYDEYIVLGPYEFLWLV